jgi:hypothetical protein
MIISADPPARLILVYNAKGGIFNMAADAVHKLVSPQTYPCSLCALSYGPLAMHQAWRKALAALPVPVLFYHKDDFPAAFPGLQITLPAILLGQGANQPLVLLRSDELDDLPSLDALIALLHARLAERGVTRP